jgi:hypothetical protein
MDRMTTIEREKAFMNLSQQHYLTQVNQIRNYRNAYYQQPAYFQHLINAIDTVLGLSSTYSVPLPNNYYQENDPWLYAFLNNIPSDVLGLMKILYEVQNPNRNEIANNPNTNAVFTNTNHLQ